METIRNFFRRSSVQWGLALAAIGGVIAWIAKVNDFSRPPIPSPEQRRDYTKDLEKLNPSKPIGVFVFNVTAESPPMTMVVNASRNNYKEKIQEHYGDNMVVIDNPHIWDLSDFSKQFNAKFGAAKPQVHVVANHHQGTYNDKKFAEFLTSIDATNKRALILACGPDSEQYKLPNFDYVIIPRPDGQLLGPEVDLKISPAYREAIGWMHDHSDADAVRKKFAESNIENALHGIRDRAMNIGYDVLQLQTPRSYKSPIVVTPPSGLPLPPKSTEPSVHPR